MSSPSSFVAWLSAWAAFLVVCVAAARLGRLALLVGLPLITGYLAVGALCGPFALGLLSAAALPALGPTTQFALAFIAFSAGAELYLPELRSLFKVIAYQTTAIAVVSFSICTAKTFNTL